jgi:hypothetical protein
MAASGIYYAIPADQQESTVYFDYSSIECKNEIKNFLWVSNKILIFFIPLKLRR